LQLEIASFNSYFCFLYWACIYWIYVIYCW